MRTATVTRARQTPTAPSAVALEPRLYTDPSLLESEQRLIFERTWQLAGHVSALADAHEIPRTRPALPCATTQPASTAPRPNVRDDGQRPFTGTG